MDHILLDQIITGLYGIVLNALVYNYSYNQLLDNLRVVYMHVGTSYMRNRETFCHCRQGQ